MEQVAPQVQKGSITLRMLQQQRRLDWSKNIDGALLHKEAFSTVLGMMNVCHGAAPRTRNVEQEEDDEVFDKDCLQYQIPL